MLCKSDERARNYEQKYVIEVQRENNNPFNYYTKSASDENKKNKSEEDHIKKGVVDIYGKLNFFPFVGKNKYMKFNF